MPAKRFAYESPPSLRASIPKRGVVLAAGRGSRLMPYTAECPKPLLTLRGRPLLDWTLSALHAADVTETCIVVRHMSEQIKSFCGSGSLWDMRITFRRQPRLDGTAPALACAADCVDEPCFVVAADYRLKANTLVTLKQSFARSGAAMAVSLKALTRSEMLSRSQVHFDRQGRVTRITEKPAFDETRDGWGASLLFILPPAIVSHLGAVEPGMSGERHLATAVNALLDRGLGMVGVKQAAPQEWAPNAPGAGGCYGEV